jgi:hypothetical protein
MPLEVNSDKNLVWEVNATTGYINPAEKMETPCCF